MKDALSRKFEQEVNERWAAKRKWYNPNNKPFNTIPAKIDD